MFLLKSAETAVGIRNGEKDLLGLFVGLNLNLFTGVFLGDSSPAMASELASSSSGTDVIL